MTHRITCTLLLTAFALAPSAFAQDATFSDVPKDHFAYEAVNFLRINKIISGYEDGTFRPNKLVNRAEAVKLIIAPLVKEDQLATAAAAKSSYEDIAQDAWFKPYVEIARVSKVIDGPPSKTAFNGSDPVIKAEYLKIVTNAYGADALSSYSEISLPLSSDVTDTSAWYYPYFRFGIASSMTMVSTDGLLNPEKQLTRAESAVLLYRYIMYKENRRNQALLSEAESEIAIVLAFLGKNEVEEAEYASARALLASRGALTSKPNEGIVKGAVKISEAFRSVVRAYKAGKAELYDEAIRLAGDAWNLASRSKEFSSELSEISGQLQTISKGIADSARAAKAEKELE